MEEIKEFKEIESEDEIDFCKKQGTKTTPNKDCDGVYKEPKPLFPETEEYQEIWDERIKEPYAIESYPKKDGLWRRPLKTFLTYAIGSYPIRDNLARKPLYYKCPVSERNAGGFRVIDQSEDVDTVVYTKHRFHSVIVCLFSLFITFLLVFYKGLL